MKELYCRELHCGCVVYRLPKRVHKISELHDQNLPRSLSLSSLEKSPNSE